MPKIGANFTFESALPNFARDSYSTLTELAAVTVIDDGHLAYCAEDGKTYKYLSSNDTDSTTGKWREFSSGSGETEFFTIHTDDDDKVIESLNDIANCGKPILIDSSGLIYSIESMKGGSTISEVKLVSFAYYGDDDDTKCGDAAIHITIASDKTATIEATLLADKGSLIDLANVLNGKQDNLSTDQLNAANSGITSTKLTSIEGITDKFFVSDLKLDENDFIVVEGTEGAADAAHEALNNGKNILLKCASSNAYIPTSPHIDGGSSATFSFCHMNKEFEVTINADGTIDTTYIDLENKVDDVDSPETDAQYVRKNSSWSKVEIKSDADDITYTEKDTHTSGSAGAKLSELSLGVTNLESATIGTIGNYATGAAYSKAQLVKYNGVVYQFTEDVTADENTSWEAVKDKVSEYHLLGEFNTLETNLIKYLEIVTTETAE